jgi:hypothetical protein
VDKQTGNKTNKETLLKNSKFWNNSISVLVVLVLLLQPPVLVLVFNIGFLLVSPRGWGDSPVFVPVFQQQMLSQLLPQSGVACPQFLEISSVAHQPFCLGVGFSLCWFIGGLFLCLAPFLCGKVSDSSASSLVSTCYAGLLIVFQF